MSQPFPEIIPDDREIWMIDERSGRAMRAEAVLAIVAVYMANCFARHGLLFPSLLIVAFIYYRIWIAYWTAHWEVPHLQLLPSELRLVRRGRPAQSLPYSDIASYKFGSKDEPFWVQVTLRSGEVGLEIPASWNVVDRLRAQRSLIRQLGPKIIPDAEKLVALTDYDDVQTLLQVHLNNPPAVPMQVGIPYRYRRPKSLRTYVPRCTLANIAGSICAATFGMSNGTFLSSGTEITALACSGLLFVGAIVADYPRSQFDGSLNDIFTLSSEGYLLVSRGKRMRRYSDPKLARGWKGALKIIDAPVIRYGTLFGAYYFDPRFIEEDV